MAGFALGSRFGSVVVNEDDGLGTQIASLDMLKSKVIAKSRRSKELKSVTGQGGRQRLRYS